MKSLVSSLVALCAALILAGCMASPVSRSGGIGSTTAVNSNVGAVIAAAQSVFSQYGYSTGPVDYPDSISFEKPAGLFGNAMWGNYGNPQTIRVRVRMVPVPGTGNIRLIPKLYTVSGAGEAGFDDQRPIMGLWNGEFGPILKKVAAQASGAGAG